MRPLILNEESKRELARIRAHAEANVLGLLELKRRIQENDAIGDNPAWVCHIPVGYRVCFTLEHQPVGLCRHVSISVDEAGAPPHPEAVNMLMAELGMSPIHLLGPQSCVYKEGIAGLIALNVISPLEDPAFLGGG